MTASIGFRLLAASVAVALCAAWSANAVAQTASHGNGICGSQQPLYEKLSKSHDQALDYANRIQYLSSQKNLADDARTQLSQAIFKYNQFSRNWNILIADAMQKVERGADADDALDNKIENSRREAAALQRIISEIPGFDAQMALPTIFGAISAGGTIISIILALKSMKDVEREKCARYISKMTIDPMKN